MIFKDRRKGKTRRVGPRRAANDDVSFINRRRDDRRSSDRRRSIAELQEHVWEQQETFKRIRRAFERRVVITGIGAIAPNGFGVKDFWSGLKKGVNCVDTITSFDTAKFPVKIAAEIKDFKPSDFGIRKEEAPYLSRSSQFANAAALLALEDSKIKKVKGYRTAMGVIMGTGASGIEYLEKQLYNYAFHGIKKVEPLTGVTSFAGALSSQISIRFGVRGPSITVSNGCTASHDAIGYAYQAVKGGMCDVVLTGASDACVCEAAVVSFIRINALATKWNDRPKRASRPFNADRDGFVISEGACVLVMEELSHALKRGATIYAEVAGYGATCDAHHMTRPIADGSGGTAAIRSAVHAADLVPQDIDYINAHGTSTPLNDKCETQVYKNVFGKHAYAVPISSIKSMIGHAVGAAGSFGVAASALAIADSYLPPTINYETPDAECDLDYVPNIGREKEVNAALSNSVGFGSKNSAIVLKKLKVQEIL